MRKNIDILFVSGLIPPAVSGAGKRALRNAIEVSKHMNVAIITRTRNSSLPIPHYVVLPDFISSKSFFGKFFNNLATIIILPWFVFFTLIKISRPKIIHVYSINWFSIFILFFSKLFWRSSIYTELTLMGSDTPNSKSRWWLYRKLTDYCINKSDCVNCMTPQFYDYMKTSGFKESKLSLITNSLENRFIIPSEVNRESLRNKLGFSSEDFLILTVAHVTERKGYILIKDLIKNLPDNFNFKFISIGSYDNEVQKKLVHDIKMELSEIGREDKLMFLGFHDPYFYLQACDLFFFGSKREGFPGALIEAMACGLPIVSKKIDKITDFIIKNNYSGIILDSDNPKDYINEILFLYRNKEIRKELGFNARVESVKRFSISTVTSKYISIYSKILKII